MDRKELLQLDRVPLDKTFTDKAIGKDELWLPERVFGNRIGRLDLYGDLKKAKLRRQPCFSGRTSSGEISLSFRIFCTI